MASVVTALGAPALQALVPQLPPQMCLPGTCANLPLLGTHADIINLPPSLELLPISKGF